MTLTYIHYIRDQLPVKANDLLFGNSDFETFRQINKFCQIFYILIENNDFPLPSFFDTRCNSYSEFAQNRKKKIDELAQWFIERISARISYGLRNKTKYLYKLGFTDNDIAEIFLEQAGNGIDMYYLLTGSSHYRTSQHSSPMLETCLIHEIEQKDIEQIKAFCCGLLPETFEYTLQILSHRIKELTFGEIKNILRCKNNFTNEMYDSAHWAWFRHESTNGMRRNNRLTKENNIQIIDRIVLQGSDLKLFFLNGKQGVWYTVHGDNGKITCLRNNNMSSTLETQYYFAIQYVKGQLNEKQRGKYDIIVNFFHNALNNPANTDQYYNRTYIEEILLDKIDVLNLKFISSLDKTAVGNALAMSKRADIQWEIYEIYQKFGHKSVEVFNLEEFACCFPLLLMIIYPGFLHKYIITGVSLRSVFPYWSKFFRLQAQKKPKNFHDARKRLAAAVIQTLGIKNPRMDKRAEELLLKIRFNLPFKKMPRYKEAFLIWALKRPELKKNDLCRVYNYIRNNKYIVDRYTTPISLKRRYYEWINHKIQQEYKDKIIEFPKPWACKSWKYQEYIIEYISDSLKLKQLAAHQENCVYSYVPRICTDIIQIYALLKQEEIIATIEIIGSGDAFVLGEYQGFANSDLDTKTENIIKKWFQSNII